MIPLNKYACLLAACLTLAHFVGCAPAGPKTYPVTGTVTLDGKPLAEGLISFKTIESGAIETMNIKDGRFQGAALAGDRRVEIYVLVTKTQNYGAVETAFKQNIIPARYNAETTLTAKVTDTGPNEFSFTLESK